MKPESTISQETLYQSKVLDFQVRQVQLLNGTHIERPILHTPGAVVIVPLTHKKEIRLIKQFRAAANKWLIELPAGTLAPGETPDAAAPRELQEETGDEAEHWTYLGGYYAAPGILNEYLHVYLATGLISGPNQLDIDEHIQVMTVSWEKLVSLLQTGEIEDAKTISGIMKASLHLGLSLLT